MNKFDFFSRADRTVLVRKIAKVLERICGYDDLCDITFRVDLLDVKTKIEDILAKYEDQAKGQKFY